jgi:hypothetical protein
MRGQALAVTVPHRFASFICQELDRYAYLSSFGAARLTSGPTERTISRNPHQIHLLGIIARRQGSSVPLLDHTVAGLERDARANARNCP